MANHHQALHLGEHFVLFPTKHLMQIHNHIYIYIHTHTASRENKVIAFFLNKFRPHYHKLGLRSKNRWFFFGSPMKSPWFPCRNEDLACGTNCAGITWDFEVQQLTFGYLVAASFFKDQGSLGSQWVKQTSCLFGRRLQRFGAGGYLFLKSLHHRERFGVKSPGIQSAHLR